MRTVAITITVLLMLAGCTQIHPAQSNNAAQPVLNANGLLTSAKGFEEGYYKSFFLLDACGGNAYGQWYREAIVAQIESCPLTLAAKEDFYKFAAQSSDVILSKFWTYYTTHPGATALPGAEKHCTGFVAPEMQAFKRKLEQYHSGKTTLFDLNLGSCMEGSIARTP